MEKKKKILITIIMVIIAVLIILLMIFSPNLIKRLTGNASNVNDLDEKQGVSNDFISEVCNVSVDNENFLTLTGKIILNTGTSGTATVNVKSDDLIFTKKIEVKSNDYADFTYILPRNTYSLSITMDGYKTYQEEISNSNELNITLIKDGMENIIASGRAYNTYYDYYSDGTINLKKVGNLNIQDEFNPDYAYFVLGDALIKYASSNGLDIKPVLEGDNTGYWLMQVVYSDIVGNIEIEGNSTKYQFIDANNKIENKECREDNYLTDEKCDNVKRAYETFHLGNESINFDDISKLVKIIVNMPAPKKVIINDDVQFLPSLAFVTSDEININENIIAMVYSVLQYANIGTLNINSEAFNEISTFALRSKINNLIMGNKVTRIPDEAFSDSEINNISLPDSLTEIGNSAFENTKMNAITIPNEVTTIEDKAFLNVGLSEVRLPNSIKIIGIEAFKDNNITTITLPSSLNQIGFEAFKNNKLTSIIIPKNITSLGFEAFSSNMMNYIYYDTSAEGLNLFVDNTISAKVEIGPNVNSISSGVFNGLSISELNLSYGIKEIGGKAFEDKGLTSVYIPNSVKIIGSEAFKNNKLTSITIPKSTIEIGYNAFSNNNFEYIAIRSINISSWGGGLFDNNKSETCNLIIDEGITNIPSHAFTNIGLTSITIPKSVITISNYAFSNNNQIKEITIKGDETRFNSNWTNIGFPENLKPSN